MTAKKKQKTVKVKLKDRQVVAGRQYEGGEEIEVPEYLAKRLKDRKLAT